MSFTWTQATIRIIDFIVVVFISFIKNVYQPSHYLVHSVTHSLTHSLITHSPMLNKKDRMETSSLDQNQPPAIATAASDKADVLWEIWKKETEHLKAEREQIEKENETMNKLNADESDIVEINVGG